MINTNEKIRIINTNEKIIFNLIIQFSSKII